MGPPLGAPPAQPPVLGTILGPIPEVAGDTEGVLGEEEARKLRNPPPDSPPPVLPRALTCPEGATPEMVRSLRSTIMKVSIYTQGRGVVCHYQQHYSNCTPFTFQSTSEQMALLKRQREDLCRYRNWLFSRSDEEACQWMRDQHGLDPWEVSYYFYCFYHF